ncbi:uncharacterized protein BT62DRAFT_1011934 [Guyanagaster necrorhizus]|uniref:Uncharacterized protein n=1 Tax=Guyanagaster necrorhizus TaxID=856835 RepID=A0A9P7VIG5_9AGAR|nr:uncharacterized protein BT62DRAFT_1011934 [Guyanagaster necrorhizus MCA 3950]KAG7441132.1 hypothetical protein BT62DRAFT_1011934 [Guyanagaster necrorhizus MCA 3950]
MVEGMTVGMLMTTRRNVTDYSIDDAFYMKTLVLATFISTLALSSALASTCATREEAHPTAPLLGEECGGFAYEEDQSTVFTGIDIVILGAENLKCCSLSDGRSDKQKHGEGARQIVFSIYCPSQHEGVIELGRRDTTELLLANPTPILDFKGRRLQLLPLHYTTCS